MPVAGSNWKSPVVTMSRGNGHGVDDRKAISPEKVRTEQNSLLAKMIVEYYSRIEKCKKTENAQRTAALRRECETDGRRGAC